MGNVSARNDYFNYLRGHVSKGGKKTQAKKDRKKVMSFKQSVTVTIASKMLSRKPFKIFDRQNVK